MLHNMGREFGATTGRPRRCGWFDAVATRQAVQVNGIDQLAVTNIDGLDKLPEIRVCTAYRLRGKTIDYVPTVSEDIEQLKPVYETFPGWQIDTTKAKNWRELPLKVRKYLKRVSNMVGAKVVIASVGPARNQTIFR